MIKSQKGFINILIITTLLIGIAVGLYLLARPTIFKSGASEQGERTLRGRIMILHSDNFESNTSKETHYFQDSSDKKLYKLVFAQENIDIRSNLPAEVHGIVRGDTFLVSRKEDIKQPTRSLPDRAFRILTNPDQHTPQSTYRMAVVLINFENDHRQPYTTATIRQKFFESNNSMAKYFQESSFNKVNFSGDVFGWYTIPVSVDGGRCSDNQERCVIDQDCSSGERCFYGINLDTQLNSEIILWSEVLDKALQAAQNNGVVLNQYDYITLIYPRQRGVFYAGAATLGKITTRFSSKLTAFTFLNGSEPGEENVIYHETGHNLNLWHASTLSCKNNLVTEVSNGFFECSRNEYGDRYSSLGGHSTNQFTGPQKFDAGWIPQDKVKIINTDGTQQVTLSPIEDSHPTNYQILRIPRDRPIFALQTDSPEEYVVSFRKNVGFDSSLPIGITKGASLHIWVVDSKYSPWIDAQVGGTWYSPHILPKLGIPFSEATLSDGETFSDLTSRVTIKQISHNSDSLTLEVTKGQTRGQGFNFHLQSGWNLIGLDLFPDTPISADSMAINLKNKTRADVIIQGFDASRGQASAYFTDPAKRILNSLTTVQSGSSYWVRVAANTEYAIQGIKPDLPAEVTYQTGWQMVSFPYIVDRSARNLAEKLKEFTGGDVIIQGFNASQGQAKAYFTDPAKQVLNSLTTLEMGWGYWLSVSQAVRIRFNADGSLEKIN